MNRLLVALGEGPPSLHVSPRPPPAPSVARTQHQVFDQGRVRSLLEGATQVTLVSAAKMNLAAVAHPL